MCRGNIGRNVLLLVEVVEGEVRMWRCDTDEEKRRGRNDERINNSPLLLLLLLMVLVEFQQPPDGCPDALQFVS